jgi:hypothetical protein
MNDTHMYTRGRRERESQKIHRISFSPLFAIARIIHAGFFSPYRNYGSNLCSLKISTSNEADTVDGLDAVRRGKSRVSLARWKYSEDPHFTVKFMTSAGFSWEV